MGSDPGTAIYYSFAACRKSVRLSESVSSNENGDKTFWGGCGDQDTYKVL